MKTARRSHRFVIAAAGLALAACAAAPQAPSDAFQAADIALTNAEKDRAADFAPLEMRMAREKLSAARSSEKPDGEGMVQARRMADEARADAELASAKARLARAEAVNLELQKSSNTLRQEVQRGPGA